jgi:hypothetical protein
MTSWETPLYKRIQGGIQADTAYKARVKRIVKKWVLKRSSEEVNYVHRCIWKAKETY